MTIKSNGKNFSVFISGEQLNTYEEWVKEKRSLYPDLPVKFWTKSVFIRECIDFYINNR